MAKEFPEVVCQFCQRKLDVPADYNPTYECSCGARYFVVSHDDSYMAPSLGHEAFGMGMQGIVEIRVIEKFDILTDYEGQEPETGDWQDLVFAFPKFEWGQLHRMALERWPKATMNRRNAFARAALALTGAVPLGLAADPTVREHAALRQHGQSGRLTLEAAAEVLVAEDSVIFGSITEVHRRVWVEEFCLGGNDPEDVAELKTSTDKPE